MNIRFHGHEKRAHQAAYRIAEVIDARGIKIGNSVRLYIDSCLNHPHELHPVGRRLAMGVANADHRVQSNAPPEAATKVTIARLVNGTSPIGRAPCRRRGEM